MEIDYNRKDSKICKIRFSDFFCVRQLLDDVLYLQGRPYDIHCSNVYTFKRHE